MEKSEGEAHGADGADEAEGEAASQASQTSRPMTAAEAWWDRRLRWVPIAPGECSVSQ